MTREGGAYLIDNYIGIFYDRVFFFGNAYWVFEKHVDMFAKSLTFDCNIQISFRFDF